MSLERSEPDPDLERELATTDEPEPKLEQQQAATDEPGPKIEEEPAATDDEPGPEPKLEWEKAATNKPEPDPRLEQELAAADDKPRPEPKLEWEQAAKKEPQPKLEREMAATHVPDPESQPQPQPSTPGRAATKNRLRAVRPWHVWACLAAAVVVVVVVAAPVLVTQRDRRWDDVLEDKDTSSNLTSARVNLGYAQYQGTLVGHEGGVAQFLGLRYAAPPTGDRRWRAPAEPEVDDSGDQAADAFRPICLGISVPYPNGGIQDEDCLFANVWAPANATADSKLPVWLFIQGGGYTQNSNANWNGTAVVERSGGNIVFVNFNYRVGLWGFLASERVRANGSAAGDLNVGLRDQIQVMRWVKSHIAQFGGDPDHVVITGASAGAGSVALHLLMAYSNSSAPAQDGSESVEQLFVGGIGESVFFPAQPTVADLEWQFDRVLAQTGCNGTDSNNDPMACLRSKDTTTLQATVNRPSAFPSRSGIPLFYWTPCVDGALLRDSPYTLLARGALVDVPVLAGSTSNEGTVFVPDLATADALTAFDQDNYPLLNKDQAASITNLYAANGTGAAVPPAHKGAWFASASVAYGEGTFVCPGNYLLDAVAARQNNGTGGGGRTWGYRYDVYDANNAAQGLGVPHIWESWAVFGPDSLRGAGAGPASYYTYAASVVPPVMDYWLSFVRTLDPSAMRTPGAPAWEPWKGDKQGRRLLMQTGNFSMESVAPDQRSRCEFWLGLASATQQRKG
ncbi:alpha/beta-hydrolase [Hypoxylon sp. NC1633]|nr:alpha/beta-hydrolase [Hypoxylon sp. NC1633]